MAITDRLRTALGSSQPGQALRTLVLELSGEGYPQAEIYRLIEEFLFHLRTNNDLREADEDALLDTLDALTGWCHPTARL